MSLNFFGKATCLTLVLATLINIPLLHAEDEKDDRERKLRLEYLMEKAEAVEVSVADKPNLALMLDENPVIRYTNPVRNSFTDGIVLLWRQNSKPAFFGALSVRGDGRVFCEFASLTSTPLRCDLGISRSWAPIKQDAVDVPLKAKLPAANDPRRVAVAMRQLVRRFGVWMYESDESDAKKQLRLLTKPLVQWSDKSNETMVMCFAFAETNDPEALVLLQYDGTSKSGSAGWKYTLSRMTSRPLAFEFDGRMVHEVRSYWQNPQTAQDSYLERRLGEYSPE